MWPFGRPSANPLDTAVPLFPLGSPRSGTTLLARLLNAHPQILMTNETAVFLMLHENIAKSRIGVQAGLLYGKQYHQLWADHLAQNVKPLVESYYEKIRREAGKGGLRYWGDKHPHHHRCLDFLAELYPNACYVYIVRDPRDTACSIAEMRGVGFRQALGTWRKFADGFEHFTNAVPAARLGRLRYEWLVADYEGEARRLFDWLGLDYDRRVERFLAKYRHVDMHTSLTGRAAKTDFGQKSVGRWRREISPEDQGYADEAAGDYLDRYGYERASG